MAAMSICQVRNKNFVQDLAYMLPVKYCFIWPSSFRGEDIYVSANQKQKWSMAISFLSDWDKIR